MAIWSNTLDELVEQTFRLHLGNWFEGECDAGTTGTIVDATRYEPDDYFQNIDAWARIRTTTDNAAPKGEEREITDWVQSSGTATVLPVFSATSGALDTYVFYTGWRWAVVKAAINRAIDMYARHALIEKYDTSIQLESSVYEYALPAGFLYIYRVTPDDGSNAFRDPISGDQWSIVRGTEQPRLRLNRFPTNEKSADWYYSDLFADSSITANRVLRIEGLGRQGRLVEDTDICKINPALITTQAAAYLHAAKITRADTDPDEHRVQYQIWQAEADRISGGAPWYNALRPQMPPDTRRVEL